MIPKLLIMIGSLAVGQMPGDEGTISGIVVNASDAAAPVGGAEVVLRVKLYGRLVPVAQTTSDSQGRFAFEHLSVGDRYEYLPGANRQGIHYPGSRVKLTLGRRRADVELAVRDAVTHPSPLIVRRHEITVRPASGALHVTETILVANPSSKSYVGLAPSEGGEPITLQLAVPADFERLTFHKEFFGRRFSMVDNKLTTGIPWTPGERELKFNYVLRNARKHRVWQRPVDLPCSELSLRVETDKPEEVRCNLPPDPARNETGENGPVENRTTLSTLAFHSGGKTLPAGHVIRLELGELSVPWTAYGRWLALLVLAALIAVASYAMFGPARRKKRPSDPTDSASQRRPTRRKRRRMQKATSSARGRTTPHS